MTRVTIDRELLERLAEWDQFPHKMKDALTELRAILAAPRQPEGEAISRERVQAEADAFFDWPTTDKSSVTTTSCLIFARCIAGMVAAERDATIAELREECERLEPVDTVPKWLHDALIQQAKRVIAELQAKLDDPDYPPKYSRRLIAELRTERDTLRQQLADSDAALRESRANDQAAMWHLADMRQQRDKLAGLLREALPYTNYCEDDGRTRRRIEAALAEAK